MHTINITGTREENREKYIWVIPSHDTYFGIDGYLRVSVEIMMVCFTTSNYGAFIEHTFPLISDFVFLSLLSRKEEKIRGKKTIIKFTKHIVNQHIIIAEKKKINQNIFEK